MEATFSVYLSYWFNWRLFSQSIWATGFTEATFSVYLSYWFFLEAIVSDCSAYQVLLEDTLSMLWLAVFSGGYFLSLLWLPVFFGGYSLILLWLAGFT